MPAMHCSHASHRGRSGKAQQFSLLANAAAVLGAPSRLLLLLLIAVVSIVIRSASAQHVGDAVVRPPTTVGPISGPWAFALEFDSGSAHPSAAAMRAAIAAAAKAPSALNVTLDAAGAFPRCAPAANKTPLHSAATAVSDARFLRFSLTTAALNAAFAAAINVTAPTAVGGTAPALLAAGVRGAYPLPLPVLSFTADFVAGTPPPKSFAAALAAVLFPATDGGSPAPDSTGGWRLARYVSGTASLEMFVLPGPADTDSTGPSSADAAAWAASRDLATLQLAAASTAAVRNATNTTDLAAWTTAVVAPRPAPAPLATLPPDDGAQDPPPTGFVFVMQLQRGFPAEARAAVAAVAGFALNVPAACIDVHGGFNTAYGAQEAVAAFGFRNDAAVCVGRTPAELSVWGLVKDGGATAAAAWVEHRWGSAAAPSWARRVGSGRVAFNVASPWYYVPYSRQPYQAGLLAVGVTWDMVLVRPATPATFAVLASPCNLTRTAAASMLAVAALEMLSGPRPAGLEPLTAFSKGPGNDAETPLPAPIIGSGVDAINAMPFGIGLTYTGRLQPSSPNEQGNNTGKKNNLTLQVVDADQQPGAPYTASVVEYADAPGCSSGPAYQVTLGVCSFNSDRWTSVLVTCDDVTGTATLQAFTSSDCDPSSLQGAYTAGSGSCVFPVADASIAAFSVTCDIRVKQPLNTRFYPPLPASPATPQAATVSCDAEFWGVCAVADYTTNCPLLIGPLSVSPSNITLTAIPTTAWATLPASGLVDPATGRPLAVTVAIDPPSQLCGVQGSTSESACELVGPECAWVHNASTGAGRCMPACSLFNASTEGGGCPSTHCAATPAGACVPRCDSRPLDRCTNATAPSDHGGVECSVVTVPATTYALAHRECTRACGSLVGANTTEAQCDALSPSCFWLPTALRPKRGNASACVVRCGYISDPQVCNAAYGGDVCTYDAATSTCAPRCETALFVDGACPAARCDALKNGTCAQPCSAFELPQPCLSHQPQCRWDTSNVLCYQACGTRTEAACERPTRGFPAVAECSLTSTGACIINCEQFQGQGTCTEQPHCSWNANSEHCYVSCGQRAASDCDPPSNPSAYCDFVNGTTCTAACQLYVYSGNCAAVPWCVYDNSNQVCFQRCDTRIGSPDDSQCTSTSDYAHCTTDVDTGRCVRNCLGGAYNCNVDLCDQFYTNPEGYTCALPCTMASGPSDCPAPNCYNASSGGGGCRSTCGNLTQTACEAGVEACTYLSTTAVSACIVPCSERIDSETCSLFDDHCRWIQGNQCVLRCDLQTPESSGCAWYCDSDNVNDVCFDTCATRATEQTCNALAPGTNANGDRYQHCLWVDGVCRTACGFRNGDCSPDFCTYDDDNSVCYTTCQYRNVSAGDCQAGDNYCTVVSVGDEQNRFCFPDCYQFNDNEYGCTSFFGATCFWDDYNDVCFTRCADRPVAGCAGRDVYNRCHLSPDGTACVPICGNMPDQATCILFPECSYVSDTCVEACSAFNMSTCVEYARCQWSPSTGTCETQCSYLSVDACTGNCIYFNDYGVCLRSCNVRSVDECVGDGYGFCTLRDGVCRPNCAGYGYEATCNSYPNMCALNLNDDCYFICSLRQPDDCMTEDNNCMVTTTSPNTCQKNCNQYQSGYCGDDAVGYDVCSWDDDDNVCYQPCSSRLSVESMCVVVGEYIDYCMLRGGYCQSSCSWMEDNGGCFSAYCDENTCEPLPCAGLNEGMCQQTQYNSDDFECAYYFEMDTCRLAPSYVSEGSAPPGLCGTFISDDETLVLHRTSAGQVTFVAPGCTLTGPTTFSNDGITLTFLESTTESSGCDVLMPNYAYRIQYYVLSGTGSLSVAFDSNLTRSVMLAPTNSIGCTTSSSSGPLGLFGGMPTWEVLTIMAGVVLFFLVVLTGLLLLRTSVVRRRQQNVRAAAAAAAAAAPLLGGAAPIAGAALPAPPAPPLPPGVIVTHIPCSSFGAGGHLPLPTSSSSPDGGGLLLDTATSHWGFVPPGAAPDAMPDFCIDPDATKGWASGDVRVVGAELSRGGRFLLVTCEKKQAPPQLGPAASAASIPPLGVGANRIAPPRRRPGRGREADVGDADALGSGRSMSTRVPMQASPGRHHDAASVSGDDSYDDDGAAIPVPRHHGQYSDKEDDSPSRLSTPPPAGNSGPGSRASPSPRGDDGAQGNRDRAAADVDDDRPAGVVTDDDAVTDVEAEAAPLLLVNEERSLPLPPAAGADGDDGAAEGHHTAVAIEDDDERVAPQHSDDDVAPPPSAGRRFVIAFDTADTASPVRGGRLLTDASAQLLRTADLEALFGACVALRCAAAHLNELVGAIERLSELTAAQHAYERAVGATRDAVDVTITRAKKREDQLPADEGALRSRTSSHVPAITDGDARDTATTADDEADPFGSAPPSSSAFRPTVLAVAERGDGDGDISALVAAREAAEERMRRVAVRVAMASAVRGTTDSDLRDLLPGVVALVERAARPEAFFVGAESAASASAFELAEAEALEALISGAPLGLDDGPPAAAAAAAADTSSATARAAAMSPDEASIRIKAGHRALEHWLAAIPRSRHAARDAAAPESVGSGDDGSSASTSSFTAAMRAAGATAADDEVIPPIANAPSVSITTWATYDNIAGEALPAAWSWRAFDAAPFPLAEMLAVLPALGVLLDDARVALSKLPALCDWHELDGAAPQRVIARGAELANQAPELESELLRWEERNESIATDVDVVVGQLRRHPGDRARHQRLRALRLELDGLRRGRVDLEMRFAALLTARPEYALRIACPRNVLGGASEGGGIDIDSIQSYEHRRFVVGGYAAASRHQLFEAKSTADAASFDLVIKEYVLGNTAAHAAASAAAPDDDDDGGGYGNELSPEEVATRRRFAREVDILRRARHPRVVPVTRVFVTADGAEGYVVMPRFAAGTVLDFINAPTTQRDAVCNGEWMRAFVREALRGVARLHEVGVIHCDVKPSNVLLDATHMPVIADFDVAVPAFDVAAARATATSLAVVGGTEGFVAPEVAADPKAASFKADVYSLGRTVERVLAAIRDRFGGSAVDASAALSSMLERMTAEAPRDRPSAAEALSDPYLTVEGVEQERRLAAERAERELELERARRLEDRVGFMRPPWYWAEQDPMADGFVKLDVSAQMRDRMQFLVESTCNNATLGWGRDQVIKMEYTGLDVQRVFRVENMRLWRRYCERRLEVGAKRWEPSLPAKGVVTMDSGFWLNKSGVDANAGEMFLWHGTKPGLVDLIARDGFEERLAGLKGLFGAGNYFAECSSKSDQYCTPEPLDDPTGGTYYIMLCRVAMGTPVVVSDQHNDLRIPPLRVEGDATQGRYDSLLGHIKQVKYREFVVYDRAQCYPEYVVEYKRRPKAAVPAAATP